MLKFHLALIFNVVVATSGLSTAASLRHHYPLDTGGNDLLNVAHLSPMGNSVNFTANGGVAGGYLSLGGSDDYLLASLDEGSQFHALGDFSTFKPFSVSFWMRQSASQASSGTQAIFGITTNSTDSSTYNTGFEVISREGGGAGLRVRARQGGGGSNAGEIATGLNVSNGTWRHVVVVYEANSRSVYVDGVFSGTNTTPIAIVTNPLRYFSIGAFIRAGQILDDFAGDVDDFQVYEGAVNPSEALQLYQYPGTTLEFTPPVVETTIIDMVDPLIGVLGAGSCVPGPCLPHSSIYPSPNTLAASPGGFANNSPVTGFAQLHAQGSGSSTMSYGNFLISPRTGAGITEASHASPIVNVVAKPYSYRGRLSTWNTDCTIVPAARSAIYEFTFPVSSDARIYMDVSRKINGTNAMSVGEVNINPAQGTISGGGTFSGNWNPASYKVYFFARVDAPVTSAGTYRAATVQDGTLTNSTSSSQRLGGWMRFNTSTSQKVRMKIAVSFVSTDQARSYLDEEIPEWDITGLETAAKEKWNEALSVVQAPGISVAEGRKLYTALFHSLTQPRNRTGDAAGWPANAPLWDDHYTLWDTWQTLFPLLSIVRPEVVAANVNAFAERFERNGRAETAFIQGKDFQVGQGGDDVDMVIGDAHAKNIPGIEWSRVWPLMRFHANRRTDHYRTLGYVSSDGSRGGYDGRMRSGSSTLAFAYGDWCAAQVAARVGDTAMANSLMQRSGNWRNVWDPTLTGDGFSGFVRARASSGAFATAAATSSSDFYQGTSWNYSFNVPHERDAMIEKMEGRSRFIQRLEFALGKNSNSYIDFTNEPCFQTISLFSHVRRPYLTSRWNDSLRNRFGDYSFPGDEDSGAMSSLYFFITAGFFPIAGQDIYYLHGPRVPRLEFNQPNGNTFTIIGENAGGLNLYVQSATLDGQPLESPVIRHSDILAGRTLAFIMGPNPSDWGTGGDFNVAPRRELVMPVRGPWSAGLGNPVIAADYSNSPVWGEGADGARNTAIHSSFPDASLSRAGDSIKLSAEVEFSGITAALAGDVTRFGWGIFNATSSATTGWAGYLATTDRTGSTGLQTIWKKPLGDGNSYQTTQGATAISTHAFTAQPIADGEHLLTLTLTRTGTGAIDYQAALTRSGDGVFIAAFTGSDLNPTGYSFNRIGFRIGNSLDVDTARISECTVVSTRTDYSGETLRIPEGSHFLWDAGDLMVGSIVNHGTLEVTGGQLVVSGNLENHATVRLKGHAGISVTGTFENHGTLDTITSAGSVSGTILNHGTLLDRENLRIETVEKDAADLMFSIRGYEGHGYQLQQSSDGSLSGSWEDVGEAIPGTGGILDFRTTREGNKQFYRIKVHP